MDRLGALGATEPIYDIIRHQSHRVQLTRPETNGPHRRPHCRGAAAAARARAAPARLQHAGREFLRRLRAHIGRCPALRRGVGAARGLWRGRLAERTYAKTIYHQDIDGRNWSGIQITTAAGVCAIVDMLQAGQLPDSGFLKMEDVDYEQFLQNRFGKYYA